jgi:hypothetical protein
MERLEGEERFVPISARKIFLSSKNNQELAFDGYDYFETF